LPATAKTAGVRSPTKERLPSILTNCLANSFGVYSATRMTPKSGPARTGVRYEGENGQAFPECPGLRPGRAADAADVNSDYCGL
jgi:hypothetical protein